MDEWVNIPGLTAKAQSLYRQSWSLLNWLAENAGRAEVSVDVWDELERVERSIGNLGDRDKFKEDVPSLRERVAAMGDADAGA